MTRKGNNARAEQLHATAVEMLEKAEAQPKPDDPIEAELLDLGIAMLRHVVAGTAAAIAGDADAEREHQDQAWILGCAIHAILARRGDRRRSSDPAELLDRALESVSGPVVH
jgi:hypothetical protein